MTALRRELADTKKELAHLDELYSAVAIERDRLATAGSGDGSSLIGWLRACKEHGRLVGDVDTILIGLGALTLSDYFDEQTKLSYEPVNKSVAELRH